MKLEEQYRRQYSWRNWKAIYDQVPLLSGDRVLDLGCGIGDQAIALAERGASVIGIDSNRDLLDYAVARQSQGITWIEANLASPSSWNQPPGGADGLWSSFTAAYFPSFQKVITDWLDTLKPGGWIALTEIDDLYAHLPLRAETRAKIEGYYQDTFERGQYDFRMGRKLKSHLENAGCEIKCETIHSDQELAFDGAASVEILDAWSDRLNRSKGLQRFLENEFETFRAELLSCLASEKHKTSARVHCVVARKR